MSQAVASSALHGDLYSLSPAPQQTSRPSSRRSDRQSSSRSAKPRPRPYDARVDPTAPDVITDLLSSIGTIGSSQPPDQSADPFSAPSPTLLRSRADVPIRDGPYIHKSLPSSYSAVPSQTYNVGNTAMAGNPTLAFLSQDPNPSPQQDAAEPPTIRTARKPSGYSKVTAHADPRSSRQPTYSSRFFASAPPLPPIPSHLLDQNGDGVLRPLYDSNNQYALRSGTANGSHGADDGRDSRPKKSFSFLRSRESSRNRSKHGHVSSPDLTNRSNSASKPASIVAFSAHGSAYSTRPPSPSSVVAPSKRSDSRSNTRRIFPGSAVTSPTRARSPEHPVSPAPTSRKSSLKNRVVKDDTGYVESAPRRSVRDVHQNGPSYSNTSIKKPGIFEVQRFVPSRTSSLQTTPRSEIKRKKVPNSAQQSPAHSAQPSTEVRTSSRNRSPSETRKKKGKDREAAKVVISPGDDDNDVMKRIQQLKEASRKRREDMANLEAAEPPPDISTGRRGVPDLEQPPSSVLAQEQIEEVRIVREYSADVSGIDTESLHPSFVNPPRSASQPTPEKNRPQTPPPLPESANQKAKRASIETSTTPTASRPNSRSKRWSSDFLPTGDGSPFKMHRRDSSRHHSTNSQNAPPFATVNEQRDTVVDSVNRYIDSPRLSQRITSTHDEKRIISFSEVGDPSGHAVLCCIGMGVTRFATAFYEELATSLQLRIITPERPGIGDSSAQAESAINPVRWPDDVRDICTHLSIPRFSILAHSAGAVYAMSTALYASDLVIGPIHLLAPWIPPSQLVPTSNTRSNSTPGAVAMLPRSQRLLRLLPTPFLKLSSVGSVASAVGAGQSSPSRLVNPRKSTDSGVSRRSFARDRSMFSPKPSGRNSPTPTEPVPPIIETTAPPTGKGISKTPSIPGIPSDPEEAKRYNTLLTSVIWDLSTRNSNPAVDLIVCLERNSPIGFNYADVKRRVVIHHGTKDARIPLDNVRWVVGGMRDADLRVLEGETHSLLSSAGVISTVLAEVSADWSKRIKAERNAGIYLNPSAGNVDIGRSLETPGDKPNSPPAVVINDHEDEKGGVGNLSTDYSFPQTNNNNTQRGDIPLVSPISPHTLVPDAIDEVDEENDAEYNFVTPPLTPGLRGFESERVVSVGVAR